MFRKILVFAMGSVLAGIGGGAHGYAAPQAAGNIASPAKVVPVPGTSLTMSLPAGWEIAPAKPGGLGPTAIHYKGSPGFDLTVKQNDKLPHAEAVMSLPYECDFMIGALQATKRFQLAQRPDYIPGEYYSRVLLAGSPQQGQALLTCLYLGNAQVAIMVRPAPGSGDESKLKPVLQAIADSAKGISALSYAPGSLNLPVMHVTASMSSGIWAVGTVSPPGSGGPRDMLVRVSGASELKILPSIAPGTCSFGSDPNRKEAPPYVSAKWEPVALEVAQPNDQLLLVVCRQITPAKMLMTTMVYGAPAVPADDAPRIATALDEIAEAIIKAQH